MQNQNFSFDFEAHNVRIIQDGGLAPWFHANDVCAALGLGNSHQSIRTHVDAEDLQRMEVLDTNGRKQLTNHVNESGLFSLVLNSRKPAAKRFKRWVTSEVLPSLRKSGSYTVPSATTSTPSATTSISGSPLQEKVVALMAIGESLAKTSGVRPGLAMAAALDAVQESTGLDVSAFRRALPSATQPLALENNLLPSPASYDDPLALVDPAQLAAALAMSTSDINARLEEVGLQRRNNSGDWELTPDGEEWGSVAPHVKGVLRPHNLIWRQEVAELILGDEAA